MITTGLLGKRGMRQAAWKIQTGKFMLLNWKKKNRVLHFVRQFEIPLAEPKSLISRERLCILCCKRFFERRLRTLSPMDVDFGVLRWFKHQFINYLHFNFPCIMICYRKRVNLFQQTLPSVWMVKTPGSDKEEETSEETGRNECTQR